MVGAGPAGVAAALAARQQDPAAEVMLLNDEPHEPYEKPPLSKAVLMGKATAHDAPIAGPQGVAAGGVVLVPNTAVAAIDRPARTVVTATGKRIGYDALVLATGSVNRTLALLPPDRRGVHYLRTEAEARALKEQLDRSRAVAVVGGGLIGLEVAAVAAEKGAVTTVIEVAPRILARVCDEETSRLVDARHRAAGVQIRLGSRVTAVDDLADGQLSLGIDGRSTLVVDLVVVGIGAAADDRLARAAGLAVDDGIVVDDHGRTSDPTILAAGDCTRFPGPHGPVRLENWRHAQEHGAVVGRNAAGGDVVYGTAPSFWSEQYDLYIQGVGWPVALPSARVRRQIGPTATLAFELDGAHIASAVGINAQRDVAMTRRLIERKVSVDAAALADPGKPLAAMLKART